MLAAAALAQTPRSGEPGATSVYNFGKLSAATTTAPVSLPVAAHKHTVQVIVTGSPTSCQIQLEGTLDDTGLSPNWFNLSGTQACTSTVMFSVTERPVTGIRVNLTALSGGTSPSVSIKYVGVQ